MGRVIIKTIPWLILFVGCGPELATQGTVRITSSDGSATLYVDDELRGSVDEYGEEGLLLDPGTHVITLEGQPFGRSSVEVSLAPGMTLTLTLPPETSQVSEDHSLDPPEVPDDDGNEEMR